MTATAEVPVRRDFCCPEHERALWRAVRRAGLRGQAREGALKRWSRALFACVEAKGRPISNRQRRFLCCFLSSPERKIAIGLAIRPDETVTALEAEGR